MLVLALWTAFATDARAADAAKPHPHQGVLSAYAGAPPRVELTAADLEKLAQGKSVLKQTQTTSGEGAGGRGVAVQDIHAEPDIIWGRITDYPAYPQMVDNVKACEVYERAGERVKVRFVIGAPMISIEYYIDHVHRPSEGWMTWRLDYSRTSDFDDTVGFWRVEALAEKPGWSRVYYSVDLKAAGWVPPPIEQAFATMGLNKATSWVKREAEAKAGTTGG
jgi:ribosome-associated toxin RatA of RatAB toxin-antitoxin module